MKGRRSQDVAVVLVQRENGDPSNSAHQEDQPLGVFPSSDSLFGSIPDDGLCEDFFLLQTKKRVRLLNIYPCIFINLTLTQLWYMNIYKVIKIL